MNEKLIVCYIGQNCADYLPLSLDSIKDVADAIVFVDGGSKDETIMKLHALGFDMTTRPENFKFQFETKRVCIHREFEKEHKGANGRARMCYLDFIKKHFMGSWALILDPDEIVDENFPAFVKKLKAGLFDKADFFDIHMRHVVKDFKHEDSTYPEHYVPRRLFKIQEGLYYPETEHPVLAHNDKKMLHFTKEFTIWHLSLVKHLFPIKKKYDNDRKKSESHTPQFLKWWYDSQILGEYPVKEYHPSEMPAIIKKHFEISDEELYFRGRGLEHKHWLECYQWIQYFKLRVGNPQVLFCGDGKGIRTFTMYAMGIEAYGFDISEYAVKHNIGTLNEHFYWQEDITQTSSFSPFDLVVAYDVLEHINMENLDKALENIYAYGKKDFLFSVPFLGDPNLEADPTHKIKESKDWWIKKLEEHHFIIKETPSWFQYHNQIIVAEK